MLKFLVVGVAITCSCLAQAQSAASLFTTKQEVLFQVAERLAIPEHTESMIVYPWMSALVDYDTDGTLDTILYGHHSSDAYIWRGTRGVAEYLPKGSWVFGVRDPVWMDVDRDGDMDGIGTEGSGIRRELFLNDGTGQFQKGRASDYWLPSKDVSEYAGIMTVPDYIPPPSHPLDAKLTKLYFVDLDNDGVDELIPSFTGKIPVIPRTYSGYSWVFKQQDGKWVDITAQLGLRDGQEQQLFAEDLDMDGDMDLLDLLAENVYRNDGGVFTRVNSAPIFGGRHPFDGDGEIDVIDLDNNGYRDLVFGHDHSTAQGIYLNTGAFTFERLEGNLIPGNRRARKFADVDNDGDIDLVAFKGAEMVVYHNVTPNPGMHVKFSSQEYFGTRVQVRDSMGRLVFNTQIYQYQSPAMSQVYVNSLHIGGVSGEVQVIVNEQTGGAGALVIDDTAQFVNNELYIPGVMIGGNLYAVEMQTSSIYSNSFTLKKYQYVAAASTTEEYLGPKFQDGVLTLPRIRTAGTQVFSASMALADLTAPMTFTLLDLQPIQ